LGCFIDQVDNHDLDVFIGYYAQLTPEKCILACKEQNYDYAGLQYGSKCYCGQQYGKYGQVSDDDCNYSCVTSGKCGGVNRNSVYRVANSVNSPERGIFFLRLFFIYERNGT
jgi:hypothetical protein